MDLSKIANKLNLQEQSDLIQKAAELRRLWDMKFGSSLIRVGEISKAIICLEIAASKSQAIFNRKEAIRLSGMSEKAYIKSFNSFQNSLGVKTKLDIRELGIQFGCIRLIPFVRKALSSYQAKFMASLTPSRRESADFTRPVFIAVAFFLSAKIHKLKIDKIKLIDLCGTSEVEFKCISDSMMDLCDEIFGKCKENREEQGKRDHEKKRKQESADDCETEEGSFDGSKGNSKKMKQI